MAMKKYVFIGLMLLLFTVPIFSQKDTSVIKTPFGLNESLTYEVKYNKAIFRGLLVGEFRFKVLATPETNPAAQTPNPNTQKYKFQGEAVSKGSLIKLFRQSINIKVETTVDGAEFRALQSEKDDNQNSRVRDSISIFDYETKRLTFKEMNPNEPNNPPRVIAAMLEDTTHDIVSAIYAMRRLPFAVGKSFTLDVTDTGVVYRIPLKVTARERIKTGLGKFWAWRVVPEIFGERGLVQGKGDMTMWITDDARRLPVRSRINAEVGRVEIRIKTAENLIPLKN